MELFVVYIDKSISWKEAELANGIIFGFLAIVYAFTMYFLISKLNKMAEVQEDESTFHSEKKKLIRQFAIFTAAYIVRALEDVLIYFVISIYN